MRRFATFLSLSSIRSQFVIRERVPSLLTTTGPRASITTGWPVATSSVMWRSMSSGA